LTKFMEGATTISTHVVGIKRSSNFYSNKLFPNFNNCHF
jgi:hypothetical protein